MIIHEQKVFLNDVKDFISGTFGIDCAAHLTLTFNTPKELLTCYEQLKGGSKPSDPFIETPYSKLVGNFVDKFGVLWRFMAI